MNLVNIFKQKPSWSLASILSIVYVLAFVQVAKIPETEQFSKTNLLFGFCIWGSPNDPNESNGCTESPVNSHLLAFLTDISMASIAILFYFMDQRKDKTKFMYIGAVFIISSHGFLHWFIQSDFINCYKKNVGNQLENIGYVLFATFSFTLGLVLFGFGFGEVTHATVCGSFVLMMISMTLVWNTDGKLMLPSLFCVSHPLSCITGLFSHKPAFNSTVANLFILCTVVGILELTSCRNFLKPFGGHFWYDLTLHTAVLAALPYVWSPAAKGKKDSFQN